MIEGGVSSMRAVPAVDVVKDRPPDLGRRSDSATIQNLAFQGREVTPPQGVVIAVTDGAIRRPDSGFPASQAEGDRGGLAALDNSVGATRPARIVGSFLQEIELSTRPGQLQPHVKTERSLWAGGGKEVK